MRKSGLEGGGVVRLRVCEVPVRDSGHTISACTEPPPPAVLVFAKSAQESRGVYRRGGEEGKEGRMTYEKIVEEQRKTGRQKEE